MKNFISILMAVVFLVVCGVTLLAEDVAYELQPGNTTVNMTTSETVTLTLKEMLFRSESLDADITSAITNRDNAYANANVTIAGKQADKVAVAAVLANMEIPK